MCPICLEVEGGPIYYVLTQRINTETRRAPYRKFDNKLQELGKREALKFSLSDKLYSDKKGNNDNIICRVLHKKRQYFQDSS